VTKPSTTTHARPFYVMGCEGVFPSTALGTRPDLPRGPWMTGQRITYDVPTPLVYGLDPDYPGELLAMYKSAAPLMRADLLAALSDAGVDNLQLFDAVLRDPLKGTEHKDYKAVNVVGVVAAADLGASQMMGTSDSTLIDADFHRLAFREDVPTDLLLFRLAESVNAIVVHDRVKRRIESAGIPGMTFYASNEWSG
jgi:hypothetical protein